MVDYQMSDYTEDQESSADQDSPKNFHKLWRVFGEMRVAEPAPERKADPVCSAHHHEEGAHLEGGERRLEVVKVRLQRGLKEAKARRC